jgi:hypothetical protein
MSCTAIPARYVTKKRIRAATVNNTQVAGISAWTADQQQVSRAERLSVIAGTSTPGCGKPGECQRKKNKEMAHQP